MYKQVKQKKLSGQQASKESEKQPSEEQIREVETGE